MGHHQHRRTVDPGSDPVQGGPGPSEEGRVSLVAIGATTIFEESGPAVLDLGPGPALPRTGFPFHQVGIGENRADTEGLGEDGRRLEGPAEGRGHYGIEAGQAAGRLLSLASAHVGQRWVGPTLPAAEGVPFGLAVPYEQHLGHRRRR